MRKAFCRLSLRESSEDSRYFRGAKGDNPANLLFPQQKQIMLYFSMPNASATTDYARFTPRLARATLATIVAVMGLGVAVTLSPLANSLSDKNAKGNDVELYRAEVARIHAGEGYYHALAAELPVRGYPTRSVFNWRTPLPLWLLSQLPSAEMGKYLLCCTLAGDDAHGLRGDRPRRRLAT